MYRNLTALVRDYLGKRQSLDDLQNLVIDITWDGAAEGHPEALELAHQLDLKIAEFTGGHISESALRQEMLSMLGLNHFVVISRVPSVKWQSRSATEQRTLAYA